MPHIIQECTHLHFPNAFYLCFLVQSHIKCHVRGMESNSLADLTFIFCRIRQQYLLSSQPKKALCKEEQETPPTERIVEKQRVSTVQLIVWNVIPTHTHTQPSQTNMKLLRREIKTQMHDKVTSWISRTIML